jgi:hypothetical protein
VSTEEVRQEIDRVVGECAGAVSLCWEPRPEGVFDSTQAVTYVRAAADRLNSVLDAEADRRVDRVILRHANHILDLRAQVKALPLIDYDKDDDELIRRADVLAALGDAP